MNKVERFIRLRFPNYGRRPQWGRLGSRKKAMLKRLLDSYKEDLRKIVLSLNLEPEVVKRILLLEYDLLLVVRREDVLRFSLPSPPVEDSSAYLYAYAGGEVKYLGTGNEEVLYELETIYEKAKYLSSVL